MYFVVHVACISLPFFLLQLYLRNRFVISVIQSFPLPLPVATTMDMQHMQQEHLHGNSLAHLFEQSPIASRPHVHEVRSSFSPALEYCGLDDNTDSGIFSSQNSSSLRFGRQLSSHSLSVRVKFICLTDC